MSSRACVNFVALIDCKWLHTETKTKSPNGTEFRIRYSGKSSLISIHFKYLGHWGLELVLMNKTWYDPNAI